MRHLRDLWYRLTTLVRPGTTEREMREEFAFHVEMEAKKLEREGIPAAEAARRARIRFGNRTEHQQAARDSWGTALIRDLGADLFHTFRQFRRRPAFSALGIGTLALGLGATIALGSVVRSVLLRPLPVTDEAALRVFWSDYNWRGVEFDFLAERARVFTLAAYSTDAALLRTETGSSALLAGVVSAGLFDVLGARPALGRTFRKGEDRPGAEPTVVLSHGIWQTELAGDPAVIGRRIVLDGQPATVIGVMPRGFFFPTPELRIWRPLNLDPASGHYQGNGWLVLIGRVAAGTSEPLVAGDIAAMAKALGERFEYPAAWDKTKDAHAKPLRTYLVGEQGPGLLLLLGAGLLILVMACANVAALILARTTDRTQEIALRSALGAGRTRLARQIVTESLTLALVAGLLGAIVAALGFRVLVASLPLTNGMAETVTLDWTAFALGLALATGVGLAVSAVPVRNLLRGELQGLGSERGVRGIGHHTSRVHGVLVTAEAAVAVLLVVGAGLMIRSVERLYSLDLGFEPRGVAALDLFAGSTDVTPATRRQFFADLVDRTAALPGVTSAALVSRLPIRDGGWQGTVAIEDNPDLQGSSAPNSMFRPVTPDYFKTLGIAITKGRGFTAADREGTPPVTVISESFAAKAWPGLDPIGRRFGHSFGVGDNLVTVIGVTEDIKITSITGVNPLVMYVPVAQRAEPLVGSVLVVAAAGGADEAVIAPIRRLVRELEPRIAVGRVTDLETVVATALAEPLRLRFFLTLFATLALVLGVVGVYSVVSYAVTRRRSEFGVRMALGAGAGQVLRQVIGRGLVPVAVGTGIGLVVAIGLGRAASGFLYQVSPADPVSLGVAVVSLLGAGIAASVIPAWRAARVSPVESLRSE